MKVSIWQQFSSNNSSSFLVVGEFQTVEAAQFAAAEIERLLVEIALWYEKPENADVRRKIGPPIRLTTPLTPIELEFSQKYQIEWGHPIDWSIHSDRAPDGVSRFERLVFVSNNLLRDSTLDCHPIDVLLQRLGGSSWCDDRDNWVLTVTCFVSQDGIIDRILADIRVRYFRKNRLHAFINGIGVFLRSVTSGYDSNRDTDAIVFQFVGMYVLEDNLPKLIRYFKEQGCDEIEYHFSLLPL